MWYNYMVPILWHIVQILWHWGYYDTIVYGADTMVRNLYNIMRIYYSIFICRYHMHAMMQSQLGQCQTKIYTSEKQRKIVQ